MDRITCDFCAHRCSVAPDSRGLCGVRRRRGSGPLQTSVYGAVLAAAVDPVEKKPLYHFLPGSSVFSVALGGCNFRCLFCQNAAIALQGDGVSPRYNWTPDDLFAAWRHSGTPAIAWTYTEPAVWQDYLIDASILVRQAGGRVIMVTNGFLSREARERLIPVVDAFNIDLKGDAPFYRELCGASQNPVVESIREVAQHRHLEVTTMVMERYHSPELLLDLRRVLGEAGVPVWHLSRFFPAHQMAKESPTSEEYLATVLRSVRRGDSACGDDCRSPGYIFAGNSRLLKQESTMCPRCGTECVRRYPLVEDRTADGACPVCGFRICGVWR